MQTEPTGKTNMRRTAEMSGILERLTIDHIGNDFADVVVSVTANSDASLIHVDLTMNQPEIGHAVEAALAAGFAFSVWLPGWNESDVLRLQLPKDPTANELHPFLYSPPASEIVALIRSELASSLR